MNIRRAGIGAEILLYQTDDGTTRVEGRMAGESFWLNRNQMAPHMAKNTR